MSKLPFAQNRFIEADIDGTVVMKFGQYQGDSLSEVPIQYLSWMLTSIDHLPEDVADYIQDHIDAFWEM